MGKHIDRSISIWIQGLKEGDDRSQQEVWDAYFSKLLVLVRNKLASEPKRDFDEEDVVLSAFDSFFMAVKRDRLPQLDDRANLWKILVVIAARKASSHRRRSRAQKRGGGRVRGETEYRDENGEVSREVDQALSTEPSPALAAELTDAYESLMAQLPDDTLRSIAQMRLEGYTNREIAAVHGCVERTIERKLERIRIHWLALDEME